VSLDSIQTIQNKLYGRTKSAHSALCIDLREDYVVNVLKASISIYRGQMGYKYAERWILIGLGVDSEKPLPHPME
jgi:hypothetical protein